MVATSAAPMILETAIPAMAPGLSVANDSLDAGAGTGVAVAPISGRGDDDGDSSGGAADGVGRTGVAVAEGTANAVADSGTLTMRPPPPLLSPPVAACRALPNATEKLLSPPALGTSAAVSAAAIAAARAGVEATIVKLNWDVPTPRAPTGPGPTRGR